MFLEYPNCAVTGWGATVKIKNKAITAPVAAILKRLG